VNCSSIFRRRGGILDEAICSLVDICRFCKSFGKAAAQDIPIFFQIACHLGRYWDGVFCLVEDQTSKLKVSVVGSYCYLLSNDQRIILLPLPLSEWTKTYCDRSPDGVVSSNPAGCMEVCLL